MHKSERGFSLIEILVSAFVLAFGVIGAIGMQLTALRTTQQSAMHTNALHLAADMADRMRANISRLQMPEAENPYLQVDFQSGQALPSSQFDCYGNVDCDPSQMAQADIADWLMRLDRSLPGVRVRICRDAVRGAGEEPNWACEAASTAAPVVIKIGWGDKEQSADENRNAMPRLNLLITSFPA